MSAFSSSMRLTKNFARICFLSIAIASVSHGDTQQWKVINNMAFIEFSDYHNISLWVSCEGWIGVATDMTGDIDAETARNLDGLQVVVSFKVDGKTVLNLHTTATLQNGEFRLVGIQHGVSAAIIDSIKKGRMLTVQNGTEQYFFTLNGSAAAINSLECKPSFLVKMAKE